MLSIRLTRVGKKKQPIYRVVVLDKRKDPWGKSLEILGNYNPRTKPSTINLKIERIKYWLSVGAQPSATVYNILIDQKIIDGKKVKTVTISKKRADKKTEAKKEEKPAEKKESTDDKQKERKTEVVDEKAKPEKTEEETEAKKEEEIKETKPEEKDKQ
ncbi:30S ribosomal protein S16 [Candidatus Parcubacteria bacterium]|nr:30S ribosomal protein S16 [Candidatus Parcubacteria bacterium]